MTAKDPLPAPIVHVPGVALALLRALQERTR